MRKRIVSFRKDESGAITVDWVVLTALVAGLAAAVIITMNEVTNGLGSSVGETLSTTDFE
ncbi:hypothetical protein [Antarcticimicrobium luteum]|uniref:Pilus assembly protein n=1 Tax=Antarcticimicrobium luteum TaxID=2547397 RepID=A0A4R5V8U2_9RHOB|nr:hypothetical protein [Antarcticimicrobium luteum]TDK48045.1 hypothetical protein E1832_10305 [Antarcticimicrobium luteum]